MTNPYRIDAPALISFSGGRTSGFMLYHVLDAFNGQLPDGVHVAFANTGKEREETLRFVHECASRWDVPVRWLEWVPPPPRRKKGDPKIPLAEDAARRFVEVGYNSASRNGEPFEALIQRKRYLPNATLRYCTTSLKIETMKWFMISLGYTKWNNIVGLRGDEMHRVFKLFERNDQGKERWRNVMPMAKLGAMPNGQMVREEDVLAFWRKQPFDLQLKPYEGNCDLCFLKRRGHLMRLIRENPTAAEWWSRMELRAAPRAHLFGDHQGNEPQPRGHAGHIEAVFRR